MRQLISLLILLTALTACEEKSEMSSINPENWAKRTIDLKGKDSLQPGQTYLSVYSQIYSQTEHRTHDLTATISMRNTSATDTVYVLKASYFDTHGKAIRSYFEGPIFLAPLETVAIVIDETDRAGGTGANFIFDWLVGAGTPEPLFDGVMISTSGQQGLSFTTQGKRTK